LPKFSKQPIFKAAHNRRDGSSLLIRECP